MSRRSTRSFRALAEKYDALFYPFFLDGVAGDAKLNQRDGIHPSAAGVEVIVAEDPAEGRRIAGARARADAAC